MDHSRILIFMGQDVSCIELHSFLHHGPVATAYIARGVLQHLQQIVYPPHIYCFWKNCNRVIISLPVYLHSNKTQEQSNKGSMMKNNNNQLNEEKQMNRLLQPWTEEQEEEEEEEVVMMMENTKSDEGGAQRRNNLLTNAVMEIHPRSRNVTELLPNSNDHFPPFCLALCKNQHVCHFSGRSPSKHGRWLILKTRRVTAQLLPCLHIGPCKSETT